MIEFIKEYKKFISIYLCWVLFHVYRYVVGVSTPSQRDTIYSSGRPIDYFYPLNGVAPWKYDITELLVYTIGPVLIYFVYLAFKKPNKH